MDKKVFTILTTLAGSVALTAAPVTANAEFNKPTICEGQFSAACTPVLMRMTVAKADQEEAELERVVQLRKHLRTVMLKEKQLEKLGIIRDDLSTKGLAKVLTEVLNDKKRRAVEKFHVLSLMQGIAYTNADDLDNPKTVRTLLKFIDSSDPYMSRAKAVEIVHKVAGDDKAVAQKFADILSSPDYDKRIRSDVASRSSLGDESLVRKLAEHATSTSKGEKAEKRKIAAMASLATMYVNEKDKSDYDKRQTGLESAFVRAEYDPNSSDAVREQADLSLDLVVDSNTLENEVVAETLVGAVADPKVNSKKGDALQVEAIEDFVSLYQRIPEADRQLFIEKRADFIVQLYGLLQSKEPKEVKDAANSALEAIGYHDTIEHAARKAAGYKN